jgi:phage baseplate assembly protein W
MHPHYVADRIKLDLDQRDPSARPKQYRNVHQCVRHSDGTTDYLGNSTGGFIRMKPNSGPHLAFPFRMGTNGRMVAVTTQEQHVRDEVVQLVLTNFGERLFLPEFGGNVRRLVFENTAGTTLATTQAGLTQALSQWLGNRVIVDSLTVTANGSEIEVNLQYHLPNSTESRSITFQGGSN